MSGWIPGMRDAFFNTLFDIAKKDSRVVLLTADTGAFCHDDWRKELPDRYINVGIAEQNLVSVAAGLSMSGKLPFIFAIIPFVTMRCYEQVRIDICCMGLPVTLVGIGGGYDYSTLGPTHHGTEDISLMRSLPDMEILIPCDNHCASYFAHLSYKSQNPVYIRLCRNGEPAIYKKNTSTDFSKGFSVLKRGDSLGIITAGRQVHTAFAIASELKEESVYPAIIDLYRVKPLPKDDLLMEIYNFDRIITIEEHFTTGGIGSTIAELLADNGLPIKLKRFGLPDSFCRIYGKETFLYSSCGLDHASIIESLRRQKYI